QGDTGSLLQYVSREGVARAEQRACSLEQLACESRTPPAIASLRFDVHVLRRRVILAVLDAIAVLHDGDGLDRHLRAGGIQEAQLPVRNRLTLDVGHGLGDELRAVPACVR